MPRKAANAPAKKVTAPKTVSTLSTLDRLLNPDEIDLLNEYAHIIGSRPEQILVEALRSIVFPKLQVTRDEWYSDLEARRVRFRADHASAHLGAPAGSASTEFPTLVGSNGHGPELVPN